jgi:hypothetical protein
VLSVSAHLTDRDRELIRLVARHRVLTTDQLTALRFSTLTTARRRLGLLHRFRPRRELGSAPWHYALGPVGAALLGQEDRDEKRWLPQVRADRQLALERSQRLGHMTGASWFFLSLAKHANARLRIFVCGSCSTAEVVPWSGQVPDCGHPACIDALARCAARHQLDGRRFHGRVSVIMIDSHLWGGHGQAADKAG